MLLLIISSVSATALYSPTFTSFLSAEKQTRAVVYGSSHILNYLTDFAFFFDSTLRKLHELLKQNARQLISLKGIFSLKKCEVFLRTHLPTQGIVLLGTEISSLKIRCLLTGLYHAGHFVGRKDMAKSDILLSFKPLGHLS